MVTNHHWIPRLKFVRKGALKNGDSLLEAKYKKFKKEHANTKAILSVPKVQLADKEELLNVTIKRSFYTFVVIYII
jgi:hypothetical protein